MLRSVSPEVQLAALAAARGIGRAARVAQADLRRMIDRRATSRNSAQAFLGPVGRGVSVSRQHTLFTLIAFYIDESNTRLPFKSGELSERARLELATSLASTRSNASLNASSLTRNLIWKIPLRAAPVRRRTRVGRRYLMARVERSRYDTELRADILNGFDAMKVAHPLAGNIHGGGFISGADGTCPSAAALLRHCLYTPGSGRQDVINSDPELRAPAGAPANTVGIINGVTPAVALRAANHWLRAPLRCAISAALAARNDIDDTGEAMVQLDEDGEEEDGD